MNICTQETIAPDECPECGGWLHAEMHGGYRGSHCQFAFCSEDCVDSSQYHARRVVELTHLHNRDLLCACDICVAAGHPTSAELDEYRAYQAGLR